MRLKPTITFEQYRDTCLAVADAKTKAAAATPKWKSYVVVIVLAAGLMFGAQTTIVRAAILAVFSFSLLCLIFSKRLTNRSYDKCLKVIYSEEEEKLNDQVLLIGEAGISCHQSKGQSTSHSTWQAFIKCIDTPDAFLFLPSPNSFVRVPKALLTSDDREQLSGWSAQIPSVPGNPNVSSVRC